MHRRVLKLDLKFKIPQGVEIHEGTDRSGFKMTNGGEYFQDKYGKTRRKFVRVIVTATKDDILDVDVVVNEKGPLSESQAAKKHLKKIIEKGGNVKKSYDDGAFYVKDFFNFLEERCIESAICNRSDASTNANGSIRRKKEVLKFKEIGYKEWAKEKDYGMR